MNRLLVIVALVVVAALLLVPVRLAAQESLMSSDASAVVASTEVLVDGQPVEHLYPIAPPAPLANGFGDWQGVLAVALGLVAWMLRRFAGPAHLFHSPLGALLITAASTTVGALVPILQAHQMSGAALFGALLSGCAAALALSNPSLAAVDADASRASRSSSMPPSTLVVVVLAMTALSGCAAFWRQPVALQRAEASALQCGLEAVQQEMASLSPSVLDALAGDSPDWRAQLQHLKVTGANALVCAVAHTLFDAIGKPSSLHEGGAVAGAELEALVARRLALADANGTLVMPSPTRRVLARGLAFLREHNLGQAPPAGAAP